MIRPVTFVTTILALSSGAWMFVVKHQAEQLDRQIGGVTSQIRASEQRIRVLRAEWALETDPNRLARLAALFLPGLKPMAPDQLVTWSELADRLPPVGADVPHLPLPPPLPDQLPAAGTLPGAPSIAATGPIASNAAPSTLVVLPPDAVPVPATTATATAAPTPVAATPAVAPPVHLAASHPAAVPHRRVAVVRHVVLPVSRHVVTHPIIVRQTTTRMRPVPLGQSVLAPERTVHPMGAQVMTINAQSIPRPMAAPVAAPMARSQPMPARQSGSVSVFGGFAANLPPPRPVAP